MQFIGKIKRCENVSVLYIDTTYLHRGVEETLTLHQLTFSSSKNQFKSKCGANYCVGSNLGLLELKTNAPALSHQTSNQ